MKAGHLYPLLLLFPPVAVCCHTYLPIFVQTRSKAVHRKIYVDSYVICVIWSSHRWCFFFVKRGSSKIVVKKRLYALSPTKLCEKQCWGGKQSLWMFPQSKGWNPQHQQVPLCLMCPGRSAGTYCWLLPHRASCLAAGRNSRETGALRAGGRVKGWDMQFREEGSWTCCKNVCTYSRSS